MRVTLSLIEFKTAKARTHFRVPHAVVFYSHITSIARYAVDLGRKTLNTEFAYEHIFQMIKSANLPAFRLCPISSVKSPVIFFRRPYPKSMVPFLDHTTAHEVLHLQHDLFAEDKVPHFVPETERDIWLEAGYRAEPLQRYFSELIGVYGLPTAFQLVSQYVERLHDFFVTQDLLRDDLYAQPTIEWERNQLLYPEGLTQLPERRRRMLSMDHGIKRALLRPKVLDEDLQAEEELRGEPEATIERRVGNAFIKMEERRDPVYLASWVWKLDEIVGLSLTLS